MADEFLPKPQTDLPKPVMDLPLPEKELPAHIESEGSKKSVVLKSFILGFVFVLILAGIAGAYLLGKSNSSQNVYQTEISSPSPTPDPTTNWKTYTGNGFTFKYPSNWLIKTGEMPIVFVYDPKSQETTPNKYLQVTNIQYLDGGLTPEDSALAYEASWKKRNPSLDLHRINTKLNGYDVSVIDAPTEMAIGKNIYIGNGDITVDINTSMNSFDSDDIENQILSTFKFTDSLSGTPIPTDQSSEVGSQSEALLNAGN